MWVITIPSLVLRIQKSNYAKSLISAFCIIFKHNTYFAGFTTIASYIMQILYKKMDV